MSGLVRLQNQAFLLLLLLGQECGTGCVLEHLTNTLIRFRGAFEILVCANLLADFLTLLKISLVHAMKAKFPKCNV
jgi:hypothetical protein